MISLISISAYNAMFLNNEVLEVEGTDFIAGRTIWSGTTTTFTF